MPSSASGDFLMRMLETSHLDIDVCTPYSHLNARCETLFSGLPLEASRGEYISVALWSFAHTG